MLIRILAFVFVIGGLAELLSHIGLQRLAGIVVIIAVVLCVADWMSKRKKDGD
jgi:hypothetical protein